LRGGNTSIATTSSLSSRSTLSNLAPVRWIPCVTLSAAATLALAGSARAVQKVHNEILETASVRLELIGLKRWTLAMIRDSLARYAPEDSLTSHACAAILRRKLGFAEAAVEYYPPNGSEKGYLAVPVLEPQDSARVRYRLRADDSLPDRREWADAQGVFREHNQDFQTLIQMPSFLLGQRSPDSLPPQLASTRPALDFLRSHRAEKDRRTALWTLAHDANTHNRVLATVILAGFAANDSTWWALADALRDDDGMVAATASQVLNALVVGAARPVNWAPMVDALRALLDGTSLFQHNTVLEVLAATKVSPTLAPALLRGGGELVLAKLGSHDFSGSSAARRFLTQVSGREYGQDVLAWESWIRSL
jgi:hypothetical protein